MMSYSQRNRFPFTACQWEELEQQALVFKYIVSGTPIPPDLIFTVQRSLDSSISSRLLQAQSSHQLGWTGFNVRKIDPEPGRCRRTDGKKWRCSKDAHQDSKYCERHMHRGRNRSRKPVENKNTNTLSSPDTRFLYDPRFPATYNRRENEQPKKVTHRFLEEWTPREKPDTQLSMSAPNSLHDFFVAGKW